MGLFSDSKKDKELKVPLPPNKSFSPSMLHQDDFETPLPPTNLQSLINESNRSGETIAVRGLSSDSIGTENTESSTQGLTYTTLSPSKESSITLPSFKTKHSALDLDALERELSIPQTTAPKKQTFEELANLGIEKEQPKTQISQSNQSFSESAKKDIPNKIQDLDSTNIKIEDIPDFLPELDIIDAGELDEKDLNLFDSEDEDTQKTIFLSFGSLTTILQHITEIKTNIIFVSERLRDIDENYKKQKNLFVKSKNIFEDVERKILFIDRTIFPEE